MQHQNLNNYKHSSKFRFGQNFQEKLLDFQQVINKKVIKPDAYFDSTSKFFPYFAYRIS